MRCKRFTNLFFHAYRISHNSIAVRLRAKVLASAVKGRINGDVYADASKWISSGWERAGTDGRRSSSWRVELKKDVRTQGRVVMKRPPHPHRLSFSVPRPLQDKTSIQKLKQNIDRRRSAGPHFLRHSTLHHRNGWLPGCLAAGETSPISNPTKMFQSHLSLARKKTLGR